MEACVPSRLHMLVFCGCLRTLEQACDSDLNADDLAALVLLEHIQEHLGENREKGARNTRSYSCHVEFLREE